MRHSLIIPGLLLSLADGGLQDNRALADAIPATLQLADGRSVAGSVAAIDGEALLLAADGRQEHFLLDDLISVEWEAVEPKQSPGTWLLFSNGDRAPLIPVDLVDDAFVCRWSNGGQRSNCRVPLEMVTGVLGQPLQTPPESSILPELSRRAFRDDTLILSDGTRLTGALDGVAADAYRVETAVGIVPVEAARVVAVAMNAALVQRPPPPERAALVTLQDGTWLTIHDLAVSGDGFLTGRTAFDADLTLPLGDVQRIALYGPRRFDLTQRRFDRVEVRPFLSQSSPPLVNRNVRGDWLQLDGRACARGFGMTSGASVTLALEPGDRQFRATVGLDDSVGVAGSVVFAVDVDGQRVFTSPVLRGDDAPMIIGPLEITGGKELTLSVEFAESGHVQDVADWCDPILVR